MKMTNSARVMVIALVVTLAFLTVMKAEDACSAPASLVNIYATAGDKTEMILDPPFLIISKDTVVVWINGVAIKNRDSQEIQVNFEDGKACKDVSLSPDLKGFGLDDKGCYVTSFIPYASTSSLKFTELGTFSYTVTTQDGKLKKEGKIIVVEK
ncbi:MAG: hypothetical protein RBT11_20255 [Desulfobacterales bacterium]|jgi:hypothetical protein|nr:hypothetical protein [Desulfobacterales bacterium]